jgi:hypothetical protein
VKDASKLSLVNSTERKDKEAELMARLAEFQERLAELEEKAPVTSYPDPLE